ncbi:MAG: hypothetical protein OES79_14625 [Planctomycetota bacterium]|nr:hypothetical protein [Planctomycetota bacterium]
MGISKGSAFPSKWLRVEDLPHAVTVEIEEARWEEMGDDSKVVVRFVGKEKGLPLNVTNWGAIEAALNEADTDRWKGKHIELYPTTTHFRGKEVGCIRVRPDPSEPPAPDPPPPAAPAIDDDIPF